MTAAISILVQEHALPFLSIGSAADLSVDAGVLRSVEELLFGFHSFRSNEAGDEVETSGLINSASLDAYDLGGYIYYAMDRLNLSKFKSIFRETFDVEKTVSYDQASFSEFIGEELRRTRGGSYDLQPLRLTFSEEVGGEDPVIVDVTPSMFRGGEAIVYKSLSTKLIPFHPYNYINPNNPPIFRDRKPPLNALPNPFP